VRDSLLQDWIDYDSAPPPQDAKALYRERQVLLNGYMNALSEILKLFGELG
jgi:hypothetical protein